MWYISKADELGYNSSAVDWWGQGHENKNWSGEGPKHSECILLTTLPFIFFIVLMYSSFSLLRESSVSV